MVERGGRLSSDLLENALEGVCRGLAGARARLEAAANQLAAVGGGWSTATLAAADVCLHSEAWHAAFHAEAGGGKEAYLRGTTLARDMLRDDLLPLLGGSAAQLTAETGFVLAPQFRALLAMGRECILLPCLLLECWIDETTGRAVGLGAAYVGASQSMQTLLGLAPGSCPAHHDCID